MYVSHSEIDEIAGGLGGIGDILFEEGGGAVAHDVDEGITDVAGGADIGEVTVSDFARFDGIGIDEGLYGLFGLVLLPTGCEQQYQAS